MAIRDSAFTFQPFSAKQRKVLNWWTDGSPVQEADGIIADGAIRSGKTLCMSLSFVLWAMESFSGHNFGMCGKTVGSFRRNVLFWLKLMLAGRGYHCEDKRSDNLLTVSVGGRTNYFYIFGGKDERSQDLIQGITLAGVFLDEVALMPESFVNQATGRCSVDGSKLWFNCNPESPSHWFKLGWIDNAPEKGLLYLHFTMDDNLSLSEKVKERYKRTYSGVWYDRFIRGEWTLAEGIIYPEYSQAIEQPPEGVPSRYVLSIDYGTQNPFSAGLWALYGKVWYRVREYYYGGRDTGVQKTDAEYLQDLNERFGDIPSPITTIIDPSAASFIALLRQSKRYKVRKADNAVLDGIRETATAMHKGLIKISPECKDWIREAQGYVWDDSDSEDRPVKVNDHAMDETRYFVKTMRVTKPQTEYVPLSQRGIV